MALGRGGDSERVALQITHLAPAKYIRNAKMSIRNEWMYSRVFIQRSSCLNYADKTILKILSKHEKGISAECPQRSKDCHNLLALRNRFFFPNSTGMSILVAHKGQLAQGLQLSPGMSLTL